MIIKASDPQGKDTKVYDAAGKRVKLLITEYNTETKEATFYVPGEGSVAMAKYSSKGHGAFEQEPMKITAVLPGSYAEIKGKRV